MERISGSLGGLPCVTRGRRRIPISPILNAEEPTSIIAKELNRVAINVLTWFLKTIPLVPIVLQTDAASAIPRSAYLFISLTML